MRIHKKRGRKVNYTVPADEINTFRGHYFTIATNLQRKAFLKSIAQLCLVSEATVRSWIADAYRPDAVKQRLIAKKLNSTAEMLFKEKSSPEAKLGS